MTERLYNEGAASQIEYMDALTVMTRAEAQSIISRYDLHIQMALLEKITAQYPLPDFDAIIQRQENILHGE